MPCALRHFRTYESNECSFRFPRLACSECTCPVKSKFRKLAMVWAREPPAILARRCSLCPAPSS